MLPKIPTTAGEKTPGEIVDYLIYSNYRHNRTISPEVTPEQWKKVYGPATVEKLEAIFQAEGKQ